MIPVRAAGLRSAGQQEVYYQIMKTFTAPNRRKVCMTVTDSGVTGIIDSTIPMSVLKGWREQLLERLSSAIQESAADALAQIERRNDRD
jgi:hypothetical protein